ncbi:MAG: AAA family ATPase [Ostreibacterium sp.]
MTLYDVLKNNKISQSKLARELNISVAAINQLVKHGKYPKRQPVEKFQQQIDKTLEQLGTINRVNWTVTENKEILLHNQEIHEMKALSEQAKQLFNLHKSPFIDDVQSRGDVYVSSEQRYIRASMLSTAKHGGFMAIVGESGAGKTTLKRDLIEGINQNGDRVIIIQPQTIDKTRLATAHLCDAIIEDVSQGTENPKRSMEAKARQIQRILTDSSRAGNKHCLIIDEAHDLTIPVLKYLKRFWELEDGMKRLLAIVLIGQPELKVKLNERNADVREVARRCEQVELQPLNSYVGEYLKHKLQRVGMQFNAVFSDDAMGGLTARLTQINGESTISLLYPLIVNNAVISAMNAAAEIGQNIITADVFEEV